MHTTHFGEKFNVVPLGFHTNTGDKSGGAIIQPLQKLGSTLIYLGFLHILLWPICVQAWEALRGIHQMFCISYQIHFVKKFGAHKSFSALSDSSTTFQNILSVKLCGAV